MQIGGNIRSPQQIQLNKAMKELYKRELDQYVQERNKMKEAEKTQQEKQKRTYNERIQRIQQMEKMKDISYKNYYQMLMATQDQHVQGYISPFANRDRLKDQHINSALIQQRKKAQTEQVERAHRQLSMKESYRKGLLEQLDQRAMMQSQKKLQKDRQKQYYVKKAQLPQQFENWEREKKRQETVKYRQDLEKVINEKQQTHMRTIREKNAAFYPRTPDNHHNPLYNPVPYNVQNPYLLKQLQKNGLIHNNSYFAGIGINNLGDAAHK